MHADDWITDEKTLPHPHLEGVWDSIVGVDEAQERLVNQVLLALRLRTVLPFTATALHGLILLYGPPGTGKTTLARGLGQEVAGFVGDGAVRLIEINPHGLMSAEHGESQQRVTELLCEHVPLRADDSGLTIVLVDEVESMAVARSQASLTANPADVHRATDAVLTALDRNAREHPHIVTVTTSNFTGMLDEAFRSRADLALKLPLPDVAGILAILQRTLSDFSEGFPALGRLAQNPQLRGVARALEGCDGRRIRKVVTEALAGRRETVLDPEALTIDDLLRAARLLEAARKEKRREAA
jgi:SpoVK/Ycf46/Vps4 family AAA+-type ATPase